MNETPRIPLVTGSGVKKRRAARRASRGVVYVIGPPTVRRKGIRRFPRDRGTAATLELTPLQERVLSRVRAGQEWPIEIARKLGSTGSSVNGALRSLRLRGLVAQEGHRGPWRIS